MADILIPDVGETALKYWTEAAARAGMDLETFLRGQLEMWAQEIAVAEALMKSRELAWQAERP
jgi:hypothetical protein